MRSKRPLSLTRSFSLHCKRKSSSILYIDVLLFITPNTTSDICITFWKYDDFLTRHDNRWRSDKTLLRNFPLIVTLESFLLEMFQNFYEFNLHQANINLQIDFGLFSSHMQNYLYIRPLNLQKYLNIASFIKHVFVNWHHESSKCLLFNGFRTMVCDYRDLIKILE